MTDRDLASTLKGEDREGMGSKNITQAGRE